MSFASEMREKDAKVKDAARKRKARALAKERKNQAIEDSALFLDELKRVGLDEKDADLANVVYVDREGGEGLTGHYAPLMAFIYPGLDGVETDYVRGKFLGDPMVTQFSLREFMRLSGRVWEPEGMRGRFYFPSILNWLEIARDKDRAIIVTDSEIDALCGARAGFNCLAIAGDFSIEDLQEDFRLIDWGDREVFLSFDAGSRVDIEGSERLVELSRYLIRRGVLSVKLVELPLDTVVGLSCGLGDYMVEFGVEGYVGLLRDAEDMGVSSVLWGLNDRFAFVRSVGLVYEFEFRRFVSKRQFFDLTSSLSVVAGDREVSAGRVWWEWGSRREYRGIDYLPGGDRLLGGDVVNTWVGFGIEPAPGDMGPFKDLFDHIGSGLTRAEKAWFWQWLAWPFQHPGEGKSLSGVLVHSSVDDPGKALLGELVARVYGDNGLVVESSVDLFGSDNVWVEGCSFLVGADCFVGSRGELSRLGKLISSRAHRISHKRVESYTRESYLNVYLSSGRDDSLELMRGDENWFVVDVGEERVSGELLDSLREWELAGGLSHLLHHLLHEVDCGGFDRLGVTPVTRSRELMLDRGRTGVERWGEGLAGDSRVLLELLRNSGKTMLFTLEDLRLLRVIPVGYSDIQATKGLKFGGFECRAQLSSVAHWPGESKRLWCVCGRRNRTMWSRKENKVWCEHYAGYMRLTGRYVEPGRRRKKVGKRRVVK